MHIRTCAFRRQSFKSKNAMSQSCIVFDGNRIANVLSFCRCRRQTTNLDGACTNFVLFFNMYTYETSLSRFFFNSFCHRQNNHHVHIYIYMCVYVCVCIKSNKKERREGAKGEREKISETAVHRYEKNENEGWRRPTQSSSSFRM